MAKEIKPDFSNCIDPEFAKAWYEFNQQLLEDARNNPLIKALKYKKNLIKRKK